MKKRSLFAAVAMLIVSALVLTSATYAWFAASTQATLQSFSATVENNNGSVQISAQSNTGWTSTLDINTVKAAQSGTVATALSPVSMHWTNTGNAQAPVWAPAFIGATITSALDQSTNTVASTFTSGTATMGTNYTQFNVYIKTDAAGTVTVTPDFSRNANFVYAALCCEGQKVVLSGAADNYLPLLSLPNGGIVDKSPENSIVDSSDTGYVSGTLDDRVDGVVNSSGALTLTYSEAGVKTLTVCMWAEGQDSNCTGTLDTASNSLALGFAYAAPSSGNG